jgi:hypothetical protein
MTAGYVVVKPLRPPFRQTVVIHYFSGHKMIALSQADADLVSALLDGDPRGRQVVLEYADDKHIRIHVSQ